MNSYPAILKRVPLFRGIAETDLEKMLDCLKAKPCRYAKESVILLAGQPVLGVGVVLEGNVQVIREDAHGNASILAELEPGELFAEALACSKTKESPVTVRSVTESAVLLLDYRRMLSSCPSSCAFHTTLIENMLYVLANKNSLLNQKIGYLSKRTTREKLMAYLSDQAVLHRSSHFTIPFNRQELADYLCVDRSAMSATLCRLRDEGVLDFSRSSFRLYSIG